MNTDSSTVRPRAHQYFSTDQWETSINLVPVLDTHPYTSVVHIWFGLCLALLIIHVSLLDDFPCCVVLTLKNTLCQMKEIHHFYLMKETCAFSCVEFLVFFFFNCTTCKWSHFKMIFESVLPWSSLVWNYIVIFIHCYDSTVSHQLKHWLPMWNGP